MSKCRHLPCLPLWLLSEFGAAATPVGEQPRLPLLSGSGANRSLGLQQARKTSVGRQGVISRGRADLFRDLIEDPVHYCWLPRAFSVQIRPLEMLSSHHEGRSWLLFSGIRKGLVNITHLVLTRSSDHQDHP